MLPRVLLAIQEPAVRKQFKELFSGTDSLVSIVRATKEFWRRLSRESADFVFISRSLLPDPVENTLKTIKTTPESPDVVVITVDEDSEERGRLLAAGCSAVLHKDLTNDVLLNIFKNLIEKRQETTRLKLTTQYSITESRLSDFVSHSPSMQAFMDIVARLVNNDSSLLILGETGVGKERLARAIHAESRRSNGPFIAINCAALPDTLLESELFGHMEGAFTGATRTRKGSFELAHRGTVFLDEIGEIPLHLQAKLLRVLQDREVQPIGSERPIPINVRIMAATNRNLEESVELKEFRPDLYYRISVVTLKLPPLRERREDIEALVENYIDYYSENLGRRIYGIAPNAMEALVQYSWPGNVRELMNVIERATLLCLSSTITLDDLPPGISLMNKTVPERVGLESGTSRTANSSSPDYLNKSLREIRNEAVARAETEYLKALLMETRGRINETAKRAGLQNRSLFEKMRRYGLRKEDFKKN